MELDGRNGFIFCIIFCGKTAINLLKFLVNIKKKMLIFNLHFSKKSRENKNRRKRWEKSKREKK